MTISLFLLLLLLLQNHHLTTSRATSNTFWWLQNSSLTFLDRYHLHEKEDSSSDLRPDHPTAITTTTTTQFPPSVQSLFDTNACEIDIVSAPLTKSKFRKKYFLNKPVLVRRRSDPQTKRSKAEERWSTIEYLNQTAGHLNVMVGTSRRIIESGGEGGWKTPLSEFLSCVRNQNDQNDQNDKLVNQKLRRPIYAFDRGHLLSESKELRHDLGSDPFFFKHSATKAKQLSYKKSENFFRGKEETLRYFLMTAGDGSGVQFHAHSDGYNTLIACPSGSTCKKLWFLTPPSVDPSPEFPIYRDWCCSPSSWIQSILPELLKRKIVGWTDDIKKKQKLLRPFFVVVQNVGETIYIPENWNHATLALGKFTVSVAGQLRIGHTPIGRTLWKADYLKSKGQHDRALSLYEKALTMDATHRETKMKLGIQWATLSFQFQQDPSKRAKFLDKARAIYLKTIKENNQDLNAIASLAEVEYWDGNANKSYELYDRALTLMPTNVGKSMYLVGKSRSATHIDGGKVSRGLFILKGALVAAHTDKEAAGLVLPDMITLLKKTHKTWKQRVKRNPTRNEKRGKLVIDRLEKELKIAEKQLAYAKHRREMVMGKGDERDFMSIDSQGGVGDSDDSDDKIVPATKTKTKFHLNAKTMRTKLCIGDNRPLDCNPSPSCGLIVVPNNTTLSRALYQAVFDENDIVSVSSSISSRTRFTKQLLSQAPSGCPAYIVASNTGVIQSLLSSTVISTLALNNQVDDVVMNHILSSVNRICGTRLFTEQERLSKVLFATLVNDKAWSTPKAQSTVLSLQSQGAHVNFGFLKHAIEHVQPATLARCFEFTSDTVKRSTDHLNQTLLHIAILGANVNQEVVKIVFDACGSDCLHAKDVNGRTPLAAALRNQINWFWEARETKSNPYAAAATLLLELGADPNTRDYMGSTPLMRASRNQNYQGVNLLLQHGANPTLVDFQKSSALHSSVEWFKVTVEISKKLVSKSIDPVGVAEMSNAMDEIHTGCTTKLQRVVSLGGAKYLGLQDGVQASEIANALVDCSFFDRIASVLIKALEETGQEDVLHSTNGINRTVLDMAHPRMRPRLLKMATSTLSSIEFSVLGDGDGADMNNRRDDMNNRRDFSDSTTVADDINVWSSEHCDFDVRSASTLSAAKFQDEYFQQSRPVLVLNATDHSWNKFRSTLSNETWLHLRSKQSQGQHQFEVGSIPFAKSFNVAESMSMSISEYLEHILPTVASVVGEQPAEKKSKDERNKKRNKNNSKEKVLPPYLFHAVDMTDVKSLKHALPLDQDVVGHLGNFSNILTSLDLFETAQWYFGSYNSGAPMHFHGSALNVLIRGTKLWAMLPPRYATYSRQHPSTFMSTFKASRAREGELDKNSEAVWCEQPSGSFLFVPAGWSHAVLNLDKVVAGVAVEIIHAGTGEASRQWRKLSEDGLDVQGYLFVLKAA